MDISERHDHDVLVIGAGGAGLRAAIEAKAAGANVAVICKSLLGKAHTVMAEGGIAAALGTVRAEDNWRVHFRDTMRGGKGMNDWRMASIHARESPAEVRRLEAWGALFDRTDDGRILQRPFGGHTYARLAHVGDRTGLEMLRTLQDAAVHGGVDVYMECTVVRLFTHGGRIAGALAYRRENGRFMLLRAKSVVLATGGGGKAWKITSNSWEYTGDGYALAYEAGADLIGMEFVQFHPTGMVWPPSVRGTLVTEGVRGEGGVLRNSLGDRFMFQYMPDMYRGEFAETEEEADRWVHGDRTGARRPPELLTRDVVAKAIMKEVQEGRGSPHGGVFLDIASKRDAQYIKRKLPGMHHQFKELADVDITKEAMEVGPTTHYFMGGIKVDPETQESTLPGLYAAGEAAAGLHGANRLGGNSLSDLLVFGARAGRYAAEAAARAGWAPLDGAEVVMAVERTLAPFGREAGENPFVVQEALQELMHAKVGIVRTAADLEQAIAELARLRDHLGGVRVLGNRDYNPGWHTALDLDSLLLVSEAVARAALERRESRGGHTRLDFPDTDAEEGRTQIVVRRSPDGGMQVAREAIAVPAGEAAELLQEGVPVG